MSPVLLPWLLACAPPPASLPPCAPPGPPLSPRVTLTVRGWAGEGVDAERVEAELAAARAWYAPWGVDVVEAAPVEEVRVGAPLAGRAGGAEAEVFAPLLDFVAAYTRPGDGVVHVLAVPEILAPDSPLRGELTAVRGLSFAPGADAPVALPGDTRVVLLGLRAMDHVAPGQATHTLAHELGHARGLAHVATPTNLLYAGAFTCVPVLTPAQLDAFRASPSSASSPPATPPTTPAPPR